MIIDLIRMDKGCKWGWYKLYWISHRKYNNFTKQSKFWIGSKRNIRWRVWIQRSFVNYSLIDFLFPNLLMLISRFHSNFEDMLSSKFLCFVIFYSHGIHMPISKVFHRNAMNADISNIVNCNRITLSSFNYKLRIRSVCILIHHKPKLKVDQF